VSGPLEVGAFLVLPGVVAGVVLLDALVELACNSADGFLVADVGGAQAAGGQPTEVLAGLDEDDRFAHACGLHGRADAADVPP